MYIYLANRTLNKEENTIMVEENRIKIVLTEYGEVLIREPISGSDFKISVKHGLSHCIGYHDICRGWIDIQDISTTHRAVVCRSCGMRVVIPMKVRTYKQLQEHCYTLFSQ